MVLCYGSSGSLIYLISCLSLLYPVFCYHDHHPFQTFVSISWTRGGLFPGCKVSFHFSLYPSHHCQNHFSKSKVQLCHTSNCSKLLVFPSYTTPTAWESRRLYLTYFSLWPPPSLSSWSWWVHGKYLQLLLFLKSELSPNDRLACPAYESHFSSLLFSHLYTLESSWRSYPLPFFSLWGPWLSFLMLHKCHLLTFFPRCTNLVIAFHPHPLHSHNFPLY